MAKRKVKRKLDEADELARLPALVDELVSGLEFLKIEYSFFSVPILAFWVLYFIFYPLYFNRRDDSKIEIAPGIVFIKVFNSITALSISYSHHHHHHIEILFAAFQTLIVPIPHFQLLAIFGNTM